MENVLWPPWPPVTLLTSPSSAVGWAQIVPNDHISFVCLYNIYLTTTKTPKWNDDHLPALPEYSVQ